MSRERRAAVAAPDDQGSCGRGRRDGRVVAPHDHFMPSGLRARVLSATDQRHIRTRNVRRSPAVLPGHRERGRLGHRRARGDHPGATTRLPRAPQRRSPHGRVAWEPGEPMPRIDYTDDEHEVWRIVCRELAPKHEKLRVRATSARPPPRSRCRSTASRSSTRSTAGLQPLTGWRYHAGGRARPAARLLGALGDRVFHSTQYIRHRAQPLYTPEPDLIHEVVGHGNLLAAPRFAEIKRQAGARRAAGGDRRGAAVPGRRLLVHDRVRRDARGRRGARLRRRHPHAPTARSRSSAAPTCGRWTSSPWRRRSTTSRTISRCCSAPTAWRSSRTSSAASSPRFDDDTPARLRGDAGVALPA